MEIKETKDVWLVIGNTDLTEGRGYPVVLHVCESFETAKRLAKGKSVMGSDAAVEKDMAVKIRGNWLAPVDIEKETDSDRKLRERREYREGVAKRMRDAGFTVEEISSLPNEK